MDKTKQYPKEHKDAIKKELKTMSKEIEEAMSLTKINALKKEKLHLFVGSSSAIPFSR